MHCNAVTNAAILHHSDNDVDLPYHYNVSLSLFSVSGLPSFKEHIFQGISFSGCFQISHMQFKLRNLNLYVEI